MFNNRLTFPCLYRDGLCYLANFWYIKVYKWVNHYHQSILNLQFFRGRVYKACSTYPHGLMACSTKKK